MRTLHAAPLALTIALSLSPLRAYAQPAPLPTLPPPETNAAPSSLNPPAPTASAPPAASPLAPPPPPPSFDATSNAGTVTSVSAPFAPASVVPVEPPPPPPRIRCEGPGSYTHDGFYVRVSSGIGALSIGGAGPTGSAGLSGLASSSMVAIGGTPSRGFVFGGAVAEKTLSSIHTSGVAADATSVQATTVGVFADWFPDNHGGWHVGGLLGLGSLLIKSVSESDQMNLSFAGQVFGGYDAWIGPQWSLGLQGVLGFSTKAELMDSNQNDTGYRLGSLSGAIEATLLYH